MGWMGVLHDPKPLWGRTPNPTMVLMGWAMGHPMSLWGGLWDPNVLMGWLSVLHDPKPLWDRDPKHCYGDPKPPLPSPPRPPPQLSPFFCSLRGRHRDPGVPMGVVRFWGRFWGWKGTGTAVSAALRTPPGPASTWASLCALSAPGSTGEHPKSHTFTPKIRFGIPPPSFALLLEPRIQPRDPKSYKNLCKGPLSR